MFFKNWFKRKEDPPAEKKAPAAIPTFVPREEVQEVLDDAWAGFMIFFIRLMRAIKEEKISWRMEEKPCRQFILRFEGREIHIVCQLTDSVRNPLGINQTVLLNDIEIPRPLVRDFLDAFVREFTARFALLGELEEALVLQKLAQSVAAEPAKVGQLEEGSSTDVLA